MPSVPEIIETICKMCYIQNKMKQPARGKRTELSFVKIWLDEREEKASREVSISSERRNSWLIEDVCC